MHRSSDTIIGAGIIGLTIARELSKRGKQRIVVLEKESELGVHASGKNSGVLHAGLYYSTDSLKAKFCIRGAGPDSTHILNAVSPGFTASFAFAEYVVDHVLRR